MKAIGWLLDAYVNDNQAVLWLKLQDRRSLRVTDSYRPDFYLEPNDSTRLHELESLLSSHPNIIGAAMEHKFVSLNRKEINPVLHIHVDSIRNFRRVLTDIERIGLVKGYYNIGILHVQRYLFNHGIAPTNKIQVECDENSRLVNLQVLDDSLEIEPPSFTWLIFEVEINNAVLSPRVEDDPISKIVSCVKGCTVKRTFEGDEAKILSRFADYVGKKDPDLLVSPKVAASLRYVLERARRLKLNIQVGREKVNLFDLGYLLPYAHKGRVCVNLDTFLKLGIAGLTEKSRFAMAPIALSVSWSPGRLIDGRQCFEALKKGVLPPEAGGSFRATTARDVIFRDKGGLILSPKTGLHENVAELDYESMYPHIIVKYNISYETVSLHSIDKTKKGFLAEIIDKFLRRRLYFKHLRTRYAPNSQQWVYCEQRQQVLKALLVCTYGYSGCFANRFNNVAAYEEVNVIARDTLVRTINIAMREGFDAVYADCDSIFVKKRDALKEEFEDLAGIICKEVGLPIALNRHYKFLVLLPQEADPHLEATRRYYGKLVTDELHYRGIELRRHDSPLFLRQFQKKILEILLDAENTAKIEDEQLKKAYDYVVETSDKIVAGEVDPESLVVSKALRKRVPEYRSMFPHVVAAIQLMQKGKELKTGENIDFIYVNAADIDPFKRVIPASALGKNKPNYDRQKYLEMMFDVAETTLGVFGFNRKQLGFSPGSRDYLADILREREQEILSEIQDISGTGR